MLAIGATLLILSGCAVSSSKSSSVQPLPVSQHYFDCDAAAGKLSRSIHRMSGAISYLEGNLRINELRRHLNWQSVVGIGAQTVEQEALFAVQLVELTNSGSLHVMLSIGSGPTLERYKLNHVVSVGEIVPFKIQIQDAETVFVQIGEGQKYSYPLTQSAAYLQFNCSTVWAEISLEEVFLQAK